MAFWGALAKPKGLAESKILVKTLTFGADGTEDISNAVYPGRPGLLVTIRELEKVDYAHVEVMSSLVNTSGINYATVAAFSGNQFTLNFAAVAALSGQVFAPDNISGINISGVLQMKAFVIGEGRMGTE